MKLGVSGGGTVFPNPARCRSDLDPSGSETPRTGLEQLLTRKRRPLARLPDGKRAQRDPELRAAAGELLTGLAPGSPSARGRCGFAVPVRSLTGAVDSGTPRPPNPLSDFSRAGSSRRWPPSPTFFLPACSHRHIQPVSPANANTARTHRATLPNSASCRAALLQRPTQSFGPFSIPPRAFSPGRPQ